MVSKHISRECANWYINLIVLEVSVGKFSYGNNIQLYNILLKGTIQLLSKIFCYLENYHSFTKGNEQQVHSSVPRWSRRSWLKDMNEVYK